MNKISIDAQLKEKLVQADQLVEFCDESGQTLGYFRRVFMPGDLLRMSPHSDEEIEELAKQDTGRPLQEIWHDLEGGQME